MQQTWGQFNSGIGIGIDYLKKNELELRNFEKELELRNFELEFSYKTIKSKN